MRVRRSTWLVLRPAGTLGSPEVYPAAGCFGDQKPGDAKGQGLRDLGHTWTADAPGAGSGSAPAPAASTTSSSGGGNGY